MEITNVSALTTYMSLWSVQYKIAKDIKYMEKNHLNVYLNSQVKSVELPEFTINNQPLEEGVRYKTIILDLDETLIRSEDISRSDIEKNGLDNYRLTYDTIVEVTSIKNHEKTIGVRLRPYCTQFLKEMSKRHEIVIFTASLEEYANKIINFIESEMGPGYEDSLCKRLYRRHCKVFLDKYYIKDLSLIKNRRIED